jgi:hypothetical protein
MPSYSPTHTTNWQEENINDFKYQAQEQQFTQRPFFYGSQMLNSTNLLSAL